MEQQSIHQIFSNNDSTYEVDAQTSQIQYYEKSHWCSFIFNTVSSSDSEVSQLQAHDKIYCIHITKLAPTVDAERLSEKFGCNIRNILMNSCCNDRSSTIECWLKHIEDRRTAEDFVDRWDGAVILESRIDCVLEEDRFELCNKYRVGKCPKSDEDCDWDHIMCTADGKCPKDCYFGHKEGTKSGYVKECKY